MRLVDDKASWTAAVDGFADRDFYHTWDYHAIAADEDERTLLFLYESERSAIALPLVVREGQIDATEFRDATSVYGYPGPLAAGEYRNPEEIERFQRELRDALQGLGLVTVFSRLNPLVGHDAVLDGLGERVVLSQTVAIDLAEPADVAISRYR